MLLLADRVIYNIIRRSARPFVLCSTINVNKQIAMLESIPSEVPIVFSSDVHIAMIYGADVVIHLDDIDPEVTVMEDKKLKILRVWPFRDLPFGMKE
jgi:hypothetical protein